MREGGGRLSRSQQGVPLEDLPGGTVTGPWACQASSMIVAAPKLRLGANGAQTRYIYIMQEPLKDVGIR